jgi:transposase
MKRQAQATWNSPAAARQRAQLIVQVQSGQITAQQAAAQMRVSRKTYYKWEKRALAAMVQALSPPPSGRPPSPGDPEKTQLQTQTSELQQKVQVLEQTLALRRALETPPAKKKPTAP